MEKIFSITVLFLLISCFTNSAFAAQKTPVAPAKAVLSPNQAVLTVVEKITPAVKNDKSEIVLTLPASALAQTLTAVVKDHSIENISFSNFSFIPADQELAGKDLEKQVVELRAKVAGLDGQTTAIQTRIDLWKSPIENATAEQRIALDKEMDQRISKLYADLATLKYEQHQQRTLLTELENRLDTIQRNSRYYIIATISLSKATTQPVDVTYSYVSNNCGWFPFYQLNAKPANSKTEKSFVQFSMDARLFQHTGLNWNNTAIEIITTNPVTALTPPNLPVWRIVERKVQPPMPASGSMASMDMIVESESSMRASGMVASAPISKAAPYAQQEASFTRWIIGERALNSGETSTVALLSENWETKFDYTIRPMVNPHAFLTARFELATPALYPQGEAIFKNEETVLTTGQFSLSDNKGEIYFGTDQMVSAELKHNSQTKGNEGFISKKQVFTWDWTIEVKNSHNREVTVRIQEPEPQTSIADATVTVTSSPKPTLKDHIYTWELTLKPKSDATIQHNAKVAVPVEMEVQPGRSVR